MSTRIPFSPPGPVAAAFYNSDAEVAAIMGPVGSAKTSTALMKIVRNAGRKKKSIIDGVRYFKAKVVRDTYPNLDKTTLATWHQWIPRDLGHYVHDSPRVHTIEFDGGLDVGRVHLVVEFQAIGELSAEGITRGFEGDLFYINEADLVAPELLTHALGRVRAGRYPGARHGMMVPGQVIMDFNAPDIENWLYDQLVLNKPEGWDFFCQPSGLSPDAENLHNLAAGYYADQMKGRKDWYIRRMIKNQFGFSRAGKPVQPDFNDTLHVSTMPIDPARDVPLVMGFDAGGTPAMTVRQHMPNGQHRVLAEVVTDPADNTGPKRFAEMVNRMLNERFNGFPRRMMTGWADPSSDTGSDKKAGEATWMQIVAQQTGIPIRPCPGNNNPTLRREAVRKQLVKLIDGAPGFLMDARCRKLRQALNSGWRFRKRAGTVGTYDPEPEKNEFSHIAEADEYAALGGSGLADVYERQNTQHSVQHTTAIDYQPSEFST